MITYKHIVVDAALVGGGKLPRPGEVSLANHSILFLDELLKFKKNVLEIIRQPMEDEKVTIAQGIRIHSPNPLGRRNCIKHTHLIL